MVGDFSCVADVYLSGDMEDLKQRLKASRSRLRNVELDDMTVFGPWATAPPKLVDWAAKLADADAALAPNEALSSLVDTTGDYFFIVRITAPPPAAAAGASVLGRQGSHMALVLLWGICLPP